MEVMEHLLLSIRTNRLISSDPMCIVIIIEVRMEEAHGQILISIMVLRLLILLRSVPLSILGTMIILRTSFMQKEMQVNFFDGQILKPWLRELIMQEAVDSLQEFR